MTSALLLHSNMQQMQEYILHRQSVSPDAPELVTLCEVQSRSFGNRIRFAGLDLAQVATQLSQTIQNGPWTNGQKDEMGRALTERLAQITAGMPPSVTLRQDTQELDLNGYLTSAKQRELAPGSALALRADSLVTLLLQLDCHHASEKCYRHFASVVASLGQDAQEPQLLYGLVNRFCLLYTSPSPRDS